LINRECLLTVDSKNNIEIEIACYEERIFYIRLKWFVFVCQKEGHGDNLKIDKVTISNGIIFNK